MVLYFFLKLNQLDGIAAWIYCRLKQPFHILTPACEHFEHELQCFHGFVRSSIA